MNIKHNARGFQFLVHPSYVGSRLRGEVSRLASQSGEAGPARLWIGDDHLLGREEVGQLVEHLQAWLKTSSLETASPKGGTRKFADPIQMPCKCRAGPVTVIPAVRPGPPNEYGYVLRCPCRNCDATLFVARDWRLAPAGQGHAIFETKQANETGS